jgi:hypothetical protein
MLLQTQGCFYKIKFIDLCRYHLRNKNIIMGAIAVILSASSEFTAYQIVLIWYVMSRESVIKDGVRIGSYIY